MRILLTSIIFFFISNVVISNETKEIIMKSHSTSEIKSFKLENGTNVSSYASEGSREDNLGNYGLSKCMGTVTTMPNNDINLNIMCESMDKNGHKSWSAVKRSGSSMAGGIGYSEIVDSTAPYKDLFIGTRCKYATNYLTNVSFTITKCPVSNDLYTKLLDLVEK